MIEKISAEPLPENIKLILLVIRPTLQPIWANSSLGKINSWVRIPGTISFVNNNDSSRNYIKIVSDSPSSFQIGISKLETHFRQYDKDEKIGVYYNMNIEMSVDEWRSYRTILAKSSLCFFITEHLED